MWRVTYHEGYSSSREIQKRMYRKRRLCLLHLATVLLAAAVPSWKEKPVSQWDADDAKQLLADSPWVKHLTPHWLADLSPFQREEGGSLNEGVGKGVGLPGTGLLGSRREAEAIKHARMKPPPAPVMVRWESARPQERRLCHRSLRHSGSQAGESCRSAERRRDAAALSNEGHQALARGNPPP
jgi:hypothetical protein